MLTREKVSRFSMMVTSIPYSKHSTAQRSPTGPAPLTTTRSGPLLALPPPVCASSLTKFPGKRPFRLPHVPSHQPSEPWSVTSTISPTASDISPPCSAWKGCMQRPLGISARRARCLESSLHIWRTRTGMVRSPEASSASYSAMPHASLGSFNIRRMRAKVLMTGPISSASTKSCHTAW
jgi:hypothetical protein